MTKRFCCIIFLISIPKCYYLYTKDFREPSIEDRSTKKARFKEDEVVEAPPAGMYFKDKVLQNDRERAYSLAGSLDEFEVTDEDVLVYTNKSMPSIRFSDRVQTELSKQWKATVIVKLLGRPISYRNLCNRLESMWNFTQGFDVIDLENNYFIVKFRSGNDIDAVLTDLESSVDCITDNIQSIQAWIRLPGMPIHYYNKKVLRYIGQMVGRVLKIDYCTEAAERGKFARIAVELDLSKPLVSQFCLDGKVQFVEYECLPRICFNCGRFGHTKDHCPDIIIANIPPTVSSGIRVEPENVMPAAEVAKPENPNFGPWMIVGKRGKPTTAYGKKNYRISGNDNRKENHNGSRFQVLEKESIEDPADFEESPTLVENGIENIVSPPILSINNKPNAHHAKKVTNAPNKSANLAVSKAHENPPHKPDLQPINRFVVKTKDTTLNSMQHSVVSVTYNTDNCLNASKPSSSYIVSHTPKIAKPPDIIHSNNVENQFRSFDQSYSSQDLAMDSTMIEASSVSKNDESPKVEVMEGIAHYPI
ncbi:uncharacterized protein LOC126672161 [Mercurialis annua]|uniref:uncharacterized protein LOC126672161 n=1 Tax=Mercurialis annua TaxID=3986 RepID=UPI00215FC9BE|nr:uncharacterized protein LOC126672161 [Mercurialis annua]